MREERYDCFSNKMRFMNLFMTLTIAAMHISYHAGKEDVVTYIMRNATAGAMGWFFFMASFWYFKDFDYSIAWNKYRKRLKTLLIPYFIWNTVYFLEVNGKTILKNGSFNGFEKDWLMSLVFTRFNGMEYMPIDGPLWYVIRLLEYFLISPLIYFCIKDKRAGVIAIVTCFFLTRNGQYYHFDGWLCLFMVGAYIGLHHREGYMSLFTHFNVNGKYKWLGVIGFIAIYTIVTIIWLIVIGSEIKMWVGLHYFIGYLMAAIPILFYDVPKIKSEVAGYSFGIYCGHMVLIPLLNKILGKVNVIIPIAGGVWAITLMLMVCTFIIMMCKILNSISPRLEALFTGER